MDIKFTVYAWRDIMKICGAITLTCPKEMIICRYIDLRFESCECIAYGSNGCQFTRISVPCECRDVPWQYHLLVKPMKIPSGTKFVEIHIDQKNKKFDVAYIDAEDDIRDAVVCDFFDGDPFDYERFWQKTHDTLNQYNQGSGQYFICVNPKYLINALEGMKSCDRVIMNFGSCVDGFTIRPYDDDQPNIEAVIYPVRPIR